MCYGSQVLVVEHVHMYLPINKSYIILQAPAHQPAPEDNLDLQWIYGYSGQSTCSNVFYNADEHIVYPAANVVVVFDKVSWKQKHLLGHTDKVTALAMHPDKVHVASGQLGKKPLVIVFNSQTGTIVRIIKIKEKIRAVSQLAFSPDGTTLVVAGQDDNHTLYLYDWKSGSLRSKGEGGIEKILALAFSPDGQKLLQAGVNHFKVMIFIHSNHTYGLFLPLNHAIPFSKGISKDCSTPLYRFTPLLPDMDHSRQSNYIQGWVVW